MRLVEINALLISLESWLDTVYGLKISMGLQILDDFLICMASKGMGGESMVLRGNIPTILARLNALIVISG